MKKGYDIFISYRRDGGESTAKILRDKLTELGYSVFFDVESLRSGDFNTKLYSVIEECSDFLLVLSPGALDRCRNEDDWVRLEIEHALEEGKNVVPVLLRGFSFPDQLPESIEPLRYKNGLESNYQFFDAFISKLQDFLTSRPSAGARLLGRSAKRRAVYLAAAVIALALAGAAWLGRETLFPAKEYPAAAAEKNLVDQLLYYAQQNLTQMELAAEYLDTAYRECETYLSHFDPEGENAALAKLEQNRRLLYQMDLESAVMDEALKTGLGESPFSAADALAMHDFLLQFCEDGIDSLYYMEFVIDPDSYLDLAVREEIVENYRAILDEKLKLIAYGANELLLPVENEEAIYDFKYEYLPQLYYIPLQAASWSDSKETLVSAEENSWNAIEKSMDRLTLQIGESNLEVMADKAELIQTMILEGASQEEAEAAADSLMGKADLLAEGEAALNEAQQEMDRLLEEAKEKFAPLESDDGDTLWGKMMRFLNLGMYDEAVSCMDMLREKERGIDPYAEAYTAAAIRFIRNIPATGIDYGLMVTGFEPGIEEHGQYEIGDVIVSLNGSLCRNYEEYSKYKAQVPEGGDFTVVVLRAAQDGSGRLDQRELLIPGNAPRVQIRELSEKDYD